MLNEERKFIQRKKSEKKITDFNRRKTILEVENEKKTKAVEERIQ